MRNCSPLFFLIFCFAILSLYWINLGRWFHNPILLKQTPYLKNVSSVQGIKQLQQFVTSILPDEETRRLTHQCNQKIDDVHAWIQTLRPKPIVIPLGGSLHSVLRFGQLICAKRDRYYDDDIDLLFVFPDETNKRAQQIRLIEVKNSLNESDLCETIRTHKVHLTCHFGTQPINIGVLVVVHGELLMGWYASNNKYYMGDELIFPLKKCLISNNIWPCPNNSSGFQALWQRGEYSKQSPIMWKPKWMNDEVQVNNVRKSISMLHEMG